MSSKKKESKSMSAEASNLLSFIRKNNLLQNSKPQDVQSEPMDIQGNQNDDANSLEQNNKSESEKMQIEPDHLNMESDSMMQAEQLFGNLAPEAPVTQRKQKFLPKQVTKNHSTSVKLPPAKSASTSKNEKPSIEQQKFIQTKSILKKGKITEQKPEKSEQQKSEEQQEQKLQQQRPIRKSVQFEGLLPLTSELQKRWKDPVQNQRKGKFDKEQQRILSEAVGKFLVTNDISLEDLQQMLTDGERSDKVSRKQKIFSLLSTALPNRSTESCYKYLKRNFNSLNRKGKWSEEQIDQLKAAVQKHGRKWTIIGKILKRSADNCYDKFRELGDENMEQRTKGIWKFTEVVQLLKLIEKMTKIKFLDERGLDRELERADVHDKQERQEITSRKYNSKNFIFHNITVLRPFMNARNFQKIDISKIRWNEISMYLKTRNTLDCRNKIVTLLQIFFHSEAKQLDQLIVDFFIEHKFQNEHEINWKEWKHKEVASDQAKNRYMIMKKMVEGRSVMNFKDIVLQLKKRVDKKAEQKKDKKNKSKSKAIEVLEEE